MKINLKTNEGLLNYVCTNEKGHKLYLGTEGDVVGPMQSVLMASAGCSVIDIVMILEKMRQEVKDVEVEVEGLRGEEHPKVFVSMKLHYKIYGDIKSSKAEDAIRLSVEKYCSVINMVNKTAEVEWTYEVINREG